MMREVLAIGHFPPPVHGMAVAVNTFVGLLEQEGHGRGVRIARLKIASDRTQRGLAHHVQRTARVGRAAMAIVRRRRRACVYLSVDAGPGMVYTVALVFVARLARVHVYLHHHSAAYLGQPGGQFAVVCSVGQAAVTHLVGCDAMAQSLREYHESARVEVLPITYALSGGPRKGRFRTDATDSTAPVVLGHMSNLSAEKGLDLAFDTLDAMSKRNRRCLLVLAGPISPGRDRELLERRLLRAGTSARYLGAVHGEARERFFDQIDVFLFPSRYRHESFGLVVGEALTRGCPVVTFTTPCIDAALVGQAGLVMATSESFPARAADWISGVWARSGRRERFEGAASDFVLRRNDAVEQARVVASTIVERALLS